MYKDFPSEEKMRGIKNWKNPKNRFEVIALHYTADPNKDPEREGKEWFDSERKSTPKADWLKEYEIDFTTRAGKLIFGNEFCDFDKNVHFVNSFEWAEPCELLMGLDFGQRNPTSALIGVWTMDNILYIVDEYYNPAIPSVSSREMFKKFEYLFPEPLDDKSLRQKRDIANMLFSIRVIDPTTKNKNRTKVKEGEEIPYSVLEEFYDHGWEFELGINDVQAGITRVREYIQLDDAKKAHLYIFKDKCPNLCAEFQNYRYQELSEIQSKTRNDSEDPVKKNDHAVDALRYLLMTRPNTPTQVKKPLTKIQKDIQNLLKPKVIVHDWDQDN